MENTKLENDAAIARWIDTDEFDPENIELEIKSGWKLLGDTGYRNGYGWNDVPWGKISPKLAGLESETVVDEIPVLPCGYEFLTIAHSDDNYNNQGTSESCAWFVTYVFRQERVQRRTA